MHVFSSDSIVKNLAKMANQNSARFLPLALVTVMLLVTASSVLCLVPVENDDFDALVQHFVLPAKTLNPEDSMNTTEILRYYGYPTQSYDVVTPDGYILYVDRIPYGRLDKANNTAPRPVVFLQHGLLAASDSWLLNGPEQSLGMLLADAGYDVWMGNFRGNKYSDRHLIIPVTSRKFWTFSFDEMGAYDLPTMVDFALKTTNQTQVILIGHSEGTTASFIALSQPDQEFAKTVKVFIALAPVAHMTHMHSPVLRLIAQFSYDLNLLFSVIGYNDFQPANKFTRWIADHVCDKAGWGQICQQIMYQIGGYDKFMYNASRADVYFSHFPAGTSSQNVAHFGQGVKGGQFAKFDWGSRRANMEHYGVPTPPLHFPQRVKVPVALIHAQNDWLATLPDVNQLKAELPNLVFDHMVPYENFNHFDFVIGKEVKFFVYDKVFEFMKKFNV